MIISLGGRRLCGKDATGAIIQSLCPSFQLYSFGSILKEEFAAKENVPLADLFNHNKEKYRRKLQMFSEETKKRFGKSYFAWALVDKLEKNEVHNAVITDTRFFIELETLEDYDSDTVPFRVNSSLYTRILRGLEPSEVDNHESETEMGDLPAEFFQERGGDLIENDTLIRDKLVEEVRCKVLENPTVLSCL